MLFSFCYKIQARDPMWGFLQGPNRSPSLCNKLVVEPSHSPTLWFEPLILCRFSSPVGFSACDNDAGLFPTSPHVSDFLRRHCLCHLAELQPQADNKEWFCTKSSIFKSKQSPSTSEAFLLEVRIHQNKEYTSRPWPLPSHEQFYITYEK